MERIILLNCASLMNCAIHTGKNMLKYLLHFMFLQINVISKQLKLLILKTVFMNQLNVMTGPLAYY